MLASETDIGGREEPTGPDNLVKEAKTRNPNSSFPPSSCRDLGLDPLIKIRPSLFILMETLGEAFQF